jgi:hypothetical protein
MRAQSREASGDWEEGKAQGRINRTHQRGERARRTGSRVSKLVVWRKEGSRRQGKGGQLECGDLVCCLRLMEWKAKTTSKGTNA